MPLARAATSGETFVSAASNLADADSPGLVDALTFRGVGIENGA
jgi:hypothetical protein